jgi:putative ABC transport system substrate-binding protein
VAGIEKAKAYCDKNNITYKEVSITGTTDLQQAALSLVGEVDAFFTPNDNTVASAMATYSQIASDAGIPIYVGADSMVIDGGLATVGIDYTVLGKQTANMIIRIIDGEKISKNPVEQIADYANIINSDTADALGIHIPESIKDNFILISK